MFKKASNDVAILHDQVLASLVELEEILSCFSWPG
jgi:hypothetical protein